MHVERADAAHRKRWPYHAPSARPVSLALQFRLGPGFKLLCHSETHINGALSGFLPMNSPRFVILSEAKDPIERSRAHFRLDSSLALRMTNQVFIGSAAKNPLGHSQLAGPS